MGSTPKIATQSQPSARSARPPLTSEQWGLFAAFREPVFLLDVTSFNILDCNSAAEAFYGYSRSELQALAFFELGHISLAESVRKKLSRAAEHPQEFAQLTADATPRYVEISPVPVDYQGTDALLCVVHDVSARYQLVRELLASDAGNREIIQNASDIIYTHDLRGRFQGANRAATELLGYSLNEVMGLTIEDVVAPEYLKRAEDAVRQKNSGNRETQTYELEVIRKDKTRVMLEVSSRLILQDGRPFAIQGIARDVTERRQVESALRESESKFRAVTENAPCAIIIYRGDQIIYANPAASAMSGYSNDELLRRSCFWEIAAPEYRDVIRSRAKQRLAGMDVPGRYEFVITTRSGEERWMDFTASTIQYEGQPAAVVMAFDVTERKRAEYALVQSEHLFRSLIENSSDVISILDTAGIIRYESPSLEPTMGYRPAEIVGLSGFDFIHPDDLPRAREAFEHSMAAPNNRSVELRLLHKDGTYRVFEAASNALRTGEQVNGLLISFRDVSERKRSESKMRASEEKYRQLFERNLAGVYASRPDGSFIDCNDSFAHIFGYSDRAEIMRVSATELYDTIGDREDFLRRLRYAKTFVNSETKLCRKDGSPVWVLENVAIMHDAVSGEEIIHGTMIDITERKQAEHALIESESKFRAVADTASSAIYIHNNDRFLYVNRASETISGYSAEELLNTLNPFDLTHPSDHSLVIARAQARKSGEQLPERYEFRILTKSGETRWLDFSASVVQFEGESAILGTAFDITERKRVETMQSAMYRIAEQAAAAEDLQDFFAATHRVVSELMYAKNYFIALWDAVSEELSFPYFVDEVDPAPDAAYYTGRGLTRYILRTGESLRVREHEFQKLVESGEVESVGAPSVDWMGAPLKSGNQTFGVIVVQSYLENVQFDEHDFEVLNFVAQHASSAILRKRHTEALRESEQRYRELVESAVYGIFRSSTRDNFLDVNPAMVRLLGYDSAEELMALNLATDVYADRDERNKLVREYQNGGRLEGVEVRWKRKDGRLITVRLSGRAVPNAQGTTEAFEMIAEDVTERRTLEEQLRQSQKMEAVGRLAGGVAHDFNNLLTVIKGYSELMLDELKPADPLRSEVDEIKKAADRAATLTRQLLAFSRQQVLAPKVLDLNSVVNNMDKLLRRLLGEDVAFYTTLEPGLGRVKADPGQIEQVVMNLAVNARDAMPRGGKLTIETANVDLDDSYARDHIGAKAGSYVMIAVSDTGSGMSQEVRQRIFEPFFTTKEMGKGTGLGLSTVYGIVKQSEGYVWVYSEPGIGSTFKVYLPRVDAPAEAPTSRYPADSPYRGNETVLLVEDEDGVRALVRQVLHKNGYTVLEARHGGEALLHCERHSGSIQLLLTDVVLEQMSGRELAQRLGAVRPEMRVLYISGYTDDAIIAHGVLSKGSAFLQKPFTTEALARKIREVLDAKVETSS